MMQNADFLDLDQDGQSAIMASLDPHANYDSNSSKGASPVGHNSKSLPDVLSTELQSLNLLADHENNRLSFLLLDNEDHVAVDDYAEFCRKLGCDPSVSGKVVSIVGNSGDGKSFALNQIFFPPPSSGESGDSEVFPTSSASDNRCTFGVWAAFEPKSQTLVLDTEGMLGVGTGVSGKPDENRRSRQLLKVLAISDVVICKSRAERIQSDLLYFLGDASKAYNNHFSNELRGVSDSSLGPSVIIFHETRFTKSLQGSNGNTPEVIIRDHLTSLDQDISAFSHLRYFGVQRVGDEKSTDESESFSKLRELVQKELEDTSVRSPRSMQLIFKAFCSLNAKFSGDMCSTSHRSFPDEYFTCRTKCSSCDQRCELQLNHESGHQLTNADCVFNKQLDNKTYMCLRCFQNGRRNLVVPKASSAEEGSWVGLAMYAWSGSVLECRTCGVIYRSRQHWYGNDSPEAAAVVHTEISHIWPGVRTLQGTQNAARRLLDGVNNLSSTVSSMSSVPSRSVSGWVADRIAPNYWRPNADITSCHLCDRRLDVPSQKIHHCRACGEGFCHECSDYKRPVPERGWGPDEHVRVCRDCYGPLSTKASKCRDSSAQSPISGGAQHQAALDENVNARKYGERVMGTLNNFASVVLDYPLNALKDSARPAYWLPDEECIQCCVCQITFDPLMQQLTSVGGSALASPSSSTQSLSGTTPKVKLHHCRQCGQGVCDDCSRGRKPVPLRGWDTPVRTCDNCINVDFTS